jgi:hypothetical protein
VLICRQLVSQPASLASEVVTIENLVELTISYGAQSTGQRLRDPTAALLEWQAMAEGAYSTNTRAQKADGAIFQGFCESRGEPYLPADPKTIRAFIGDRVKAGKKPATVKRCVATIAQVHVAAGLLNPCSNEAVRLGLKKMGRDTSARQDQPHPLGWKDVDVSRSCPIGS